MEIFQMCLYLASISGHVLKHQIFEGKGLLNKISFLITIFKIYYILFLAFIH